MKQKQLTTRQLVAKYVFGDFNSPDREVQCDAGWYDWFCEDTSLVSRTHKLYPKVIKILEADAGKRINQDKTYVWFKNNCPADGHLYDDFRFSDLESGDVLYTITPRSGHNCEKGRASLWGSENNFNEPLVEGTWWDIIRFFKSPLK